MTRKSVGKWIGRALEMGLAAALKDTYHRPKAPVITEEGKPWVGYLACSKPKDLGYAAELWTRKALAKYVREHASYALAMKLPKRQPAARIGRPTVRFR